MVKASKGLRRKTRNILGKTPRTKGMSPITHEFRNFEVGEKVNVVIDPAVHHGMPHMRFQGKTGVVSGKQGRAYVVELKDGDKPKTVVTRPEHLKKSL
ncbi:50S ribosomal protein L21e [Candidatus Methanomassiliicoccus intestinalis]|jgi:ribosomal protein L21e|uniref:Large ribosomal subunit protein eL21 n=2 Tax=Candidatus Methanomassiliicoccus intestinalis TaxID=1406512 RepID=R9TAL1_METII|nr:50S ribosomal protein L21e [Candidatus Methanomassiliicoccus intestinalis]AGN26696.1 50S ribosomal protein L21e [Candidatus Methanomassiliicoccus intestinalis Issoire-Mx1]TQS82826.1 MAG: 50S ribosomal protein L21 [Candidatus Methanomassiliicoccus intestinalis]TQS83679.1 MAG: 50S ribosomal protein L21 [Candidatus Methanomassiliicoccus intestinalis]